MYRVKFHRTFWVCPGCGSEYDIDDIPEECPECGHEYEYHDEFERKEE